MKPAAILLIVFGLILIGWGSIIMLGAEPLESQKEIDDGGKLTIVGTFLCVAGIIGGTWRKNENVPRFPHHS